MQIYGPQLMQLSLFKSFQIFARKLNSALQKLIKINVLLFKFN